jgi:hypothetical protein
MIIAANLDGYSSSSRSPDLRISTHLRFMLDDTERPYQLFTARSRMFRSKSRAARRFVRKHASPDNVLLCTGKSLGARNIVRYVLNIVGPLQYKRIYLLTVDPNWPEWWDLTPNLNDETLRLTRFVTEAINVRVISDDLRQQCGAELVGCGEIVNYNVAGSNHQDIVNHPATLRTLARLVLEASL